MSEWDVLVSGPAEELRAQESEDFSDRLVTDLSNNAAAVSLGQNHLEVRVTVNAGSTREAVNSGWELVHGAVSRCGIEHWNCLATSASRSDFNHETFTSMPALVGVAELAERLGVSRQRVSSMHKTNRFPPTVAELRSGPVWLASSIDVFASTWDRTPGRRPSET